MNYRVHLFATVRVEYEVEAVSAGEAAFKALAAEPGLYGRFDRPGEQYAEQVDDCCLVDPLTDETDRHGRRIPDYEKSEWLPMVSRT